MTLFHLSEMERFLRDDANEVQSAASNLSNTTKTIGIKNSERIVCVPKLRCFIVIGPTGKVLTAEKYHLKNVLA